MSIDWGSVPDWIAGIATTGALLFAYRAVKAANQQNQHQAAQLEQLEEEQRERDRDRHRTQAEKVAAWHEVTSDSNQFGPVSFPVAYDEFVIRNASDLPIYSVFVAASGSGREHADYAVEDREVVPPGIHSLRMEYADSVKPSELGARVRILFRDSGGRYWVRRESGILEEHDEDTWDMERRMLLQAQADIRDAISEEDRAARNRPKRSES